MQLRPRNTGPSSSRGNTKGKYEEYSDDDFFDWASSDSDYKAPSDEEKGEDLLNVLDDGSEIELELSDDDDSHNVSQASKKRRRKSLEEDEDAVAETDFAEEKPDKRKKGRKKKDQKKDKPVLMWEVWQQENESWIAENKGIDIDSIDQSEIVQESAEPSNDLIIPLLRYQKEWLAWALKQEESAVKGGILADEMGMGKTLQAIALVLLKREMFKGIADSSSSEELPAIKGTLVICPLVAVMQWASEIERFTSKGSTKVLIYHGANRVKNQYKFSDYDFVITTYSIVEAEYRRLLMPPKDKCQYCGKLFHPNKLSVHLKYICGPDAVKTAKQSKQLKKESKSKKVVVSKVSTSRVGKKKGVDDVDATDQPQKSILHSFTWNRIILDEAHYIKARRSNTTKAVLSLKSLYKWALSGTPLQNRVGELYSLLRFLQVVPYSFYFCKDCDCRSLDYGAKLSCSDCGHSNVRHFCWWNKYIATPIQDFGNNGFGGDAMLLLKQKILKSLLLRRTKKGRAADLALPPRIVTLRRDSLDVVEEDYYSALYNESQAQFNTYIDAGTVLNNYAHIFDLLTRLRQAVDHPYLVEYSRSSMQRKGNIVDNANDEKCSLCHDPEEDTVVTSCGHVFCKQCLIDFNATLGENCCPSCSKPLTVDFTANEDKERGSKTTIKGFKASSILNRIKLDCFQTSTKIDALKEEIRSMVERDGSAKGIVFSQFSSFLDLIHYALQKSGVNCVQLDGSMTMAAREAAIKKFSEDPDCRIFIMSLKAGGVALNLTVASNVFLMDPWWNPAVERQAQDRIHRIGQYKPITVVRFIIENTIEARILKLQEKKELVFEGTVGGSSEALAKLTEADLKFLFVT